jgi:hypothetical protein
MAMMQARRVALGHRHPELVSASIAHHVASYPKARWMLKQVQHDALNGMNLELDD